MQTIFANKDATYSLPLPEIKCAFALVEVILTLIIVGVVMALTIPTVIRNFKEKETISKVKKMYVNLQSAYNMATKENGQPKEWSIIGSSEASATNIYNILFKPYFKIAKVCGVKGKFAKGCITNVMYKRLDGRNHGNYYSGNYFGIILNDGASVWFRGRASKEESENNGIIFYDINGAEGPNVVGVDLFNFYVTTQVFPGGMHSKNPMTTCSRKSSGWGCTTWIVYKENMEYLRCDNLSWNGKKTCSR